MKILLDAKTSNEKGARVTNEKIIYMFNFLQNHLNFLKPHARILSLNFIQKGQFAWSIFSLSRAKSSGSSKNTNFSFDHQRLHARDLNFVQWLVGFTDGDGCFSITKSNEKFNLSFSISQSVYNIRVLAYIKKNIGVGSVSTSKNMAVYRVRNAKHLRDIIFPLFELYSLQTFKLYHANKLKLATIVMLDQTFTLEQKRDCLSLLKSLPAPDDLTWSRLIQLQTNYKHELSDDWLIGFIEAEASFFITKKAQKITPSGDLRGMKNFVPKGGVGSKMERIGSKMEGPPMGRPACRFTCSFAITQKRDSYLLEKIRKRFNIPSKILWQATTATYKLETTNQKVLWHILDVVKNKMKGMKSLELKLWSKALYYQDELKFRSRGDRLPSPSPNLSREKIMCKLEQIQKIFRNLKNRHKVKSTIVP
jgi:hypothetical protein